MFPSVIGMVVSRSGPVTHSPADLSIGSAGSSQLSSPWDLPMTEGSCCTHGHDWSVQGTKAFYLNEETNRGNEVGQAVSISAKRATFSQRSREREQTGPFA